MTVSHSSLWRNIGSRILWLLLVILLAVPALPHLAEAQQPAPRRNLFDLLFGGPRYEREPDDDRYERAPRRQYDRDGSIIDMPSRQRPRPVRRSPAPRPVPSPLIEEAPKPVDKLDTARQVLIVGDFMAGGIAGELETTFTASPGVKIVDRSEVASGLVRQDHFDWQVELPGMMELMKPAVVIVMVGANDRQQMQIGDTKEKLRSDAWFKEYEARAAKLAASVTSRKIPLLWVGLPSFQSPSATADAISFNTIYRNQVERVGGEFVDVWDGFVNDDGDFVVTGSDVSGQQVRLRNSDGINFTKAGKKKLAFYVEKFLRRHLGEMASPDLVKLETGAPTVSPLQPAPGQTVPTHPISLSDPELDGGKDLLGAGPLPTVMTETPRDKLVKRGELAPAPVGRIDDYRVKVAR